MISVKGSKTQEISHQNLQELTAGFETVVADLGTGDGRFVYKEALNNPKNFYVGIEPNQKQLSIYSKESNKKRLENVLFVVGSVEVLPTELMGIFDELNILLPWGTLLQKIVSPTPEAINNLKSLIKANGTIHIIFGYDEKYDPNEVQRLGLDKMDEEYMEEIWVQLWKNEGFEIIYLKQLTAKEVRELETSWAKKLSFGNLRPWHEVRMKLHAEQQKKG